MDEINETTTAFTLHTWGNARNIVFSWYDYVLFVVMLAISALIGVYFGCFGNKQSTAVEYLLGGKNMKVVPVALSMIASAISGVTILAVPADIYRYGIAYWTSCMTVPLVAAATCYIYLPVFHKLQLTSSYEYLKIRFNTKTRRMASFLFALNSILYAPIVIYVPAIAFSHVTNIDTHLITPLVFCVCIFYTTIGGLKAVIWTDAVQFSAMLAAMAAVFYLGVTNTGGFRNIWETSKSGGRLDVDMDINPLKRDTFWAATIGLSFNWISYIGINQGNIQKFLSLPSMKDCRKALIIVVIGMVVNKTYTTATGLMMYTKYHDCDPMISGRIKRPDQIIPYFLMDVAADIPGLPGLFIAGLFCAALSTLSAMMNSLAGTIYEDFISDYMPKDVSEKKVSNILKALVVLIGILSTGLVYLVEKLGSLFPLAISFASVSAGPMVGLFTLGMLCPAANSKGAFIGGVTSLGFLTWIMVGAQYYKSTGILKYPPLPTSLDGCSLPRNVTAHIFKNSPSEQYEVFFLYRISYYYYTLIGALVAVIVGLFVSWIARNDDPPVHRDLISPVMQWMLPDDKPGMDGTKYYSVENALNIVVVTSEEDIIKNK